MSMFEHQLSETSTVDWVTPRWILNPLGDFDLDPCVCDFMPWSTARKIYRKEDDGLSSPWNGRVWLNPPYGREVDLWMKKMAEHNHGIALIFARTETAVWHDYVFPKASGILFLKGRIHFCNVVGERAPHNSGAPSALISYGINDYTALVRSGLKGKFINLSGEL